MPESVSPKPQRRILYLLLALFFLPVATSFFLYYGMEWRPAGGTNHGQLLQPMRQLPASAQQLQGKWALVYVGDGACGEACRHALYIARQTHLLLNKDLWRVNRALLDTANCCDRAFLDAEHEGILILDLAEPATRAELLAQLPPGDHSHHLFVIDPLQNIVLRFDTRENPRGLLDDLKKLLKLSQVG
ncbi:MAG TPA: hypothetical protein VMK82_10485 [Steroidobacteraceae bacterium]|nr:hypothetical protein [Steroidobacteraceae bacterium]